MSAAFALVLELRLLQGLKMLRALQDELTFGAVSRRELPVATHLPYTRHVDDWIVRTKTGLLMNFIKLDGFSFQTADWSEINVRMLGRNDLVRTLANSRFAIYSHIIRREVEPKIPSTFDNDLCREIDERYDASLSKRRMFVNDIYLTIVRRPLQGHAGTFELMLQGLLGRKNQAGRSADEDEALMELRDVTTAITSSLAAYRPRHLRVVERERRLVFRALGISRAIGQWRHSAPDAFAADAARRSNGAETPVLRPERLGNSRRVEKRHPLRRDDLGSGIPVAHGSGLSR